jgi:1-deoxy-D-xylulose-5-phosphate reductoisomerase
MGPKVTIDSATLANKGYEVVETHWLYGLPYDRIDVVAHPESVVHALVELVDGSVKAQLAAPDMRLPIQYALLGGRAPNEFARLDLLAAGQLRFRAIEAARYPCLEVVLEIARSGDRAAMIGLSAADEVAVERFLAREIGFLDIAVHLRRGAEIGARQGVRGDPDLETTLRVDAAVRAALAREPVVA